MTTATATREDLGVLEPHGLWHYFIELSRIPRGSKNEAAAARWVADMGRALGCEVHQDAVGNVIIRKPAAPGREGAPVTALQAHVDMVCEKNEGTPHDFLKDPIALRRVGDRLYATGTTLGADNGVGVAAALAVLASKDIQHGPLEVLVTIDEETGLTGAANLASGQLKAKYLLNLDSEEEGDLTIGCAGGIDTTATRKMALRPATAGHAPYRLKVMGLKGGHSGMEINAGRGNSLRILGSVLWTLGPRFGLEVAALAGGNKRNAIPREASAVLWIAPAQVEAFQAALKALEADHRSALGAFDPGLAFVLEPKADAPAQVWEDAGARAVASFLFTCPHGVEANSPDIPGLVQTSTNLAIIATNGDQVEISTSQRSSIHGSKMDMAHRVAASLELCGFTVKHGDGYPGWKPEPSADLVKLVTGVHEKVFGKPMAIKAIHAGLECGLIGEKYPGMQMVSFGPDMWDVHTPDEHVSIPSVGNFWKLLVAVLENA
ncbi:aminoacyl-histidine dipeptidase [Mesoterricola sediminis]|uniref:Cytosol non-specific dipeptidase n=1 Tax=Mesoterricola sediminis TaxID=2927980 RepID=A0AA48HHH9_9BACT|nr:aminoacyl-histidine dipeptidase [Mesoterricola sediminis]BDU78318.1 aminoacyl-histidine dipeptidase [Mesoterricola sediminis]